MSGMQKFEVHFLTNSEMHKSKHYNKKISTSQQSEIPDPKTPYTLTLTH